MGALILCSEMGLEYEKTNSLSYLKGWTKGKDEAILEAYTYSCDAVEYLLKDIELEKLIPKSLVKRAETENNEPEPENPVTKSAKTKKTAKNVTKKPIRTGRKKWGNSGVKNNPTKTPQKNSKALNRFCLIDLINGNVFESGLTLEQAKAEAQKDDETVIGEVINGKARILKAEELNLQVELPKKKEVTKPKKLKQQTLKTPIDLFWNAKASLFRGIPEQEVKAFLSASEKWDKAYLDTLTADDFADEQREILGVKGNKEPKTQLIRFDRGYLTPSDNGMQILDKFELFKKEKSNLKPVKTAQLSLFGVDSVNEQFNNDLDSFISNKLKKKYFELGLPNDILMSIGMERFPIRLTTSVLSEKIKKHKFNPLLLKDLPLKIQGL
jgi:hypothetical protein